MRQLAMIGSSTLVFAYSLTSNPKLRSYAGLLLHSDERERVLPGKARSLVLLVGRLLLAALLVYAGVSQVCVWGGGGAGGRGGRGGGATVGLLLVYAGVSQVCVCGGGGGGGEGGEGRGCNSWAAARVCWGISGVCVGGGRRSVR